MEFKGDEFMKNIEIEKEKAELQRRFDSLEAEKNETIIPANKYYDDEPVIVDIHKDKHNQPLDDILLDSNNESKKKYIVLAVVLSLLFVLTIVIIRLISNDQSNKKTFSKPKVEAIKQDKILNTPNADEKYQKIIDKKIKKDLNIDNITQQEIPVPKVKKPVKKVVEKVVTNDGDLFGMLDEKKLNTKKEVEKVIIKKVITPKPILVKVTSVEPKAKIVAKITGSYVQVGAFIKAPSQVLLQNIKKNGYNYIIHKMTIKGTTYNKVLVGPYENRKAVDAVIGKVKKDLNKPGAYVLKLK